MVIKNYCSVTNEGLKDCPGFCCRYCPESQNPCPYQCGRDFPKVCKYRISKVEFLWRKLLDTLEFGTL